MQKLVLHNDFPEGVSRLGFLECTAWEGAGVLCVIEGGIPRSYNLSYLFTLEGGAEDSNLTGVQISDGHIALDVDAALWSIYPEWGRYADDDALALSCLRHFGSVTRFSGYLQ